MTISTRLWGVHPTEKETAEESVTDGFIPEFQPTVGEGKKMVVAVIPELKRSGVANRFDDLFRFTPAEFHFLGCHSDDEFIVLDRLFYFRCDGRIQFKVI